MGQPKALVDWFGRPLITYHVEALTPFAQEVVVVVGSRGEDIRDVLPEHVDVVSNPDWRATTPLQSLALALDGRETGGGVWVSPVDVVPSSHDTLHRLLAAGAPAVPTTPTGEPGHPVLIDAATAAKIRHSDQPGGLARLLRHAPRVITRDPHLALDFDDPTALDKARTFLS